MSERKPGIDPQTVHLWEDHELENALGAAFEQAAYHQEKANFWKADVGAIFAELQKRKASRP